MSIESFDETVKIATEWEYQIEQIKLKNDIIKDYQAIEDRSNIIIGNQEITLNELASSNVALITLASLTVISLVVSFLR